MLPTVICPECDTKQTGNSKNTEINGRISAKNYTCVKCKTSWQLLIALKQKDVGHYVSVKDKLNKEN